MYRPELELPPTYNQMLELAPMTLSLAKNREEFQVSRIGRCENVWNMQIVELFPSDGNKISFSTHAFVWSDRSVLGAVRTLAFEDDDQPELEIDDLSPDLIGAMHEMKRVTKADCADLLRYLRTRDNSWKGELHYNR